MALRRWRGSSAHGGRQRSALTHTGEQLDRYARVASGSVRIAGCAIATRSTRFTRCRRMVHRSCCCCRHLLTRSLAHCVLVWHGRLQSASLSLIHPRRVPLHSAAHSESVAALPLRPSLLVLLSPHGASCRRRARAAVRRAGRSGAQLHMEHGAAVGRQGALGHGASTAAALSTASDELAHSLTRLRDGRGALMVGCSTK